MFCKNVIYFLLCLLTNALFAFQEQGIDTRMSPLPIQPLSLKHLFVSRANANSIAHGSKRSISPGLSGDLVGCIFPCNGVHKYFWLPYPDYQQFADGALTLSRSGSGDYFTDWVSGDAGYKELVVGRNDDISLFTEYYEAINRRSIGIPIVAADDFIILLARALAIPSKGSLIAIVQSARKESMLQFLSRIFGFGNTPCQRIMKELMKTVSPEVRGPFDVPVIVKDLRYQVRPAVAWTSALTMSALMAFAVQKLL